jgi:hypothetical protein
MKANEQPCPYPDNFKSGPPRDEKAHDVTPDAATLNEGWPPKGHLKGDNGEFIESVWGVFDGQRKN